MALLPQLWKVGSNGRLGLRIPVSGLVLVYWGLHQHLEQTRAMLPARDCTKEWNNYANQDRLEVHSEQPARRAGRSDTRRLFLKEINERQLGIEACPSCYFLSFDSVRHLEY